MKQNSIAGSYVSADIAAVVAVHGFQAFISVVDEMCEAKFLSERAFAERA